MKTAHIDHLQYMHTTGLLQRKPNKKLEEEMIREGLLRRSLGGNLMTAKGVTELAKSKVAR